MSKALTAAAVERLRPQKTRREISDSGCPGLFLVIQPSGTKGWAMRFRRPDGSPAKLTLGRVDVSGKEMPAEPVIPTRRCTSMPRWRHSTHQRAIDYK